MVEKCTRCGADLLSGATACPECGSESAGRSGEISPARPGAGKPWRFPASALAERLANDGLVAPDDARALAEEGIDAVAIPWLPDDHH